MHNIVNLTKNYPEYKDLFYFGLTFAIEVLVVKSIREYIFFHLLDKQTLGSEYEKLSKFGSRNSSQTLSVSDYKTSFSEYNFKDTY